MGAALLAFVHALPDHVVIDRLVRGRAWIPVLGLMLAGIVAMQIEVLKLGASIGRSVQQTSSLRSTNELLQADVASLADDQRIESVAAKMGMVMPAPTTVGFLSSHASVRRAIAGIRAANPTQFLSALSGTIAAANQGAPATAPVAAITTGQAGGIATGSPATSAGTSASAGSAATGAAASSTGGYTSSTGR